jgi:hypothetical protein
MSFANTRLIHISSQDRLNTEDSISKCVINVPSHAKEFQAVSRVDVVSCRIPHLQLNLPEDTKFFGITDSSGTTVEYNLKPGNYNIDSLLNALQDLVPGSTFVYDTITDTVSFSMSIDFLPVVRDENDILSKLGFEIGLNTFTVPPLNGFPIEQTGYVFIASNRPNLYGIQMMNIHSSVLTDNGSTGFRSGSNDLLCSVAVTQSYGSNIFQYFDGDASHVYRSKRSMTNTIDLVLRDAKDDSLLDFSGHPSATWEITLRVYF